MHPAVGRRPPADKRPWLIAALATAVAVLVFVAILAALSMRPPGRAPLLGVLEADPTYLAQDNHAGIRFATLNLSWAKWEPRPGRTNARYRAAVVAQADTYRAAGWKVAVDIGLQQPPGWAAAGRDGRLVDQYGTTSSTADFEFSQRARDVASRYVSDVVHSMGHIDDYRVGLSENGETLYPDTATNQWWAFAPQAQGSAAGLPRGVGATPLPGWVPGSSTWKGKEVTIRQVNSWYDWYFGAMVNAHAWEISTYRAAGYRGQLELVMPGTGALPEPYDQRLAGDLAPDGVADGYFTLNTGAVWWRFLDALPSLAGLAVDVSSVGDQSGMPPANGCQAGDGRVNYLTDPQIYGWSDARWLTFLAGRHRLPILGENPGNTPPADLPAILSLTRSCHLAALQWAWDYQLRGGGPTVDVTQLGAAFKAQA